MTCVEFVDMAPTTTSSTPARTPRTTCDGGPIGSGSWDDSGRDVYAYFNNDIHGYAVRNAESLRALLEH